MNGVNIDLGKASDIISAIGTLPGLIRSGITGDISADAKAKIEAAAQAADAAVLSAQSLTNNIEAASPNLFIAGWRPFIGWVCGIGDAFAFIVKPLVEYIAASVGHPITLPTIDPALRDLGAALLGLNIAARSVEKITGKAGNH
jgi:hypothetical protein